MYLNCLFHKISSLALFSVIGFVLEEKQSMRKMLNFHLCFALLKHNVCTTRFHYDSSHRKPPIDIKYIYIFSKKKLPNFKAFAEYLIVQLRFQRFPSRKMQQQLQALLKFREAKQMMINFNKLLTLN